VINFLLWEVRERRDKKGNIEKKIIKEGRN